jgi:prolyl-tRNA synthetase
MYWVNYYSLMSSLYPVETDSAVDNQYVKLLTDGGYMDYYGVSGCYVMRPPLYKMWEQVQSYMNEEFETMDVENCYFPMFALRKNLEIEKEHVQGFSPEVAWVTHVGSLDALEDLKEQKSTEVDGTVTKSSLAEPLALRPTSESIMYPSFAEWIRSHNQLPLKYNQWSNVVRWEFKQPTPLLRSREFLWQEGHTCHATSEGALKEVKEVLDFYHQVYRELMAVYTIRGEKTKSEKFPGADLTTSIEAIIPQNGKAIQAATSHFLGTHFSEMFKINFTDKDEKIKFVFQNSWGLTTRSLGIMLLSHMDDKGFVLPPKIASTQVVLMMVGLNKNLSQQDKDNLHAHCVRIVSQLKKLGLRVKFDDDNSKTLKQKFERYESLGIPLRIEVGPKEQKNSQIAVCKRNDGKKQVLTIVNDNYEAITNLLFQIQSEMYNKNRQTVLNRLKISLNYSDLIANLNQKCVSLIPLCNTDTCEEQCNLRMKAQDLTATKTLCKPYDIQELGVGQVDGLPAVFQNGPEKCIHCQVETTQFVLYGRSY